MTHPWRRFFDGCAPRYMEEGFTRNTLAEVDFVLDELRRPVGSHILDMGCGTGRHTVELARRGYRMTGVDLSAGMLAEAEKAARAAGVSVEWIQSDATQFTSLPRFDGALCLCEGAFGLLGLDDDPDEHDRAILRHIAHALKPGARFILTCLNGYNLIRRYTQADVESGAFDPLTLMETHPMEWDAPDGKQTVMVRERGYLPQEIVRMMREAGLRVENIWGGTAGKWGRRKIELDEIEIMFVARRAA